MEACPDELRALQRVAHANGWAAMPGRKNHQPVMDAHGSRGASAELGDASLVPMADTAALQLSQYW